MKIVHRMIGAALLLSVTVCLGAVARATDSAAPVADLPVLKLVPEDALALVLINHLDTADAQIGQLTQAMQIPAPPVLPMMKARAGVQEGLDDHGSAAFAFLPGDAGSPGPVAVGFIPVTDYKKFIAQLQPEDAAAEITKITVTGESSLAGHKAGFAVVVDAAHKELLKRILDSSRPIAPVVGSLSGWIGEHEISFVATPTGVKHGIAAARMGLAQVKAALANSNDQTTKMAAGGLEAYDSLLATAEKEVSEFAVGARVDNDGGLHLDTRTLFVPGGSWATAAKGLGNSEGAKLASLPGGTFMMAFDGAMPKSFSKGMMSMSVNMMSSMSKASGGKELSEDQAKQFNSLMEKAMADVRSMSMVMGPPKPGGSIYSSFLGVMKVKNAAKYLADYQKAMESMSSLFKGFGMDIQEIKKVKIDDMDGLELTMDLSAMFKNMPKNPGSKQMMQMLFGPEGKLSVFLAPIDESTVAMSYVNFDGIARAKAASKNPQTSLAADADIAQTARLLPAGAQWVGYISPKGLMDFTSAMMAAFAPPGVAMPALPAFPQTPPIGIGAEASAKGFDLQIVVPGATIKGVGTYVKQMQQMFAPVPRPQIR